MNIDINIQKFKKLLDNLTQKEFDKEFRDFVYFHSDCKKYEIFSSVGGYVKKYGIDGYKYITMLFDRLEKIDSENNCNNYFNAIEITKYPC
jgi:hypothetical protein